MSRSRNTIRLTQLALLAAIEVILTFTPLGFIPLPTVSITTVHIPVIIGAILLGPIDGGILGLVMGLCSLFKATFTPTEPSSVLFSPFISGNPFGSIIMTVGARIMIGIVTGYVYKYLSKINWPTTLNVAISAVCGSLTNTILVLGSMSIFFNEFPLVQILGMIIGINAVLEIFAAVVISVAVCIPVMRYLKRKIVVKG